MQEKTGFEAGRIVSDLERHVEEHVAHMFMELEHT